MKTSGASVCARHLARMRMAALQVEREKSIPDSGEEEWL